MRWTSIPSRCAFFKTPEDFLGPKAIFEIQSLSIQSEVLGPKTSAKFLPKIISLAFKQTKTEPLLVNSLHIKKLFGLFGSFEKRTQGESRNLVLYLSSSSCMLLGL